MQKYNRGESRTYGNTNIFYVLGAWRWVIFKGGVDMAKRGAKNKYELQVKPYLDLIQEKVRQGVIEAEIAKALGISVASLNNYKQQHEELREALSKNKGADVLQGIVNAGIKGASGYFVEEETTSIVFDKDGNPKKTKIINKRWIPANPSLNIFYAKNFGKNEGFVSDPLDYELKKAKQELDEELARAENWDKFLK